MNTQKQITQSIAESNQVSVEQVAEVLGIPTGRVYCSAFDQPVYLAGQESARLASFSVECIMRSNDGPLIGVARVMLDNKLVQLPVYFSPEERVWRLHLKAFQAHPELYGGIDAEG